uniref:Uncharacterized protein n=1 Tax=Nelumbo nucifera TaxID=4432 RepID=A0A822YM31_NELNU|nr:TPA_asm: hypothetical protein HUJ06_011492 [Nelumbo nucifera]
MLAQMPPSSTLQQKPLTASSFLKTSLLREFHWHRQKSASVLDLVPDLHRESTQD